jgi:hypothetical protein
VVKAVTPAAGVPVTMPTWRAALPGSATPAAPVSAKRARLGTSAMTGLSLPTSMPTVGASDPACTMRTREPDASAVKPSSRGSTRKRSAASVDDRRPAAMTVYERPAARVTVGVVKAGAPMAPAARMSKAIGPGGSSR